MGVEKKMDCAIGPIPARAGEPPKLKLKRKIRWAYPRSRGGTPVIPSKAASLSGLSPLARGNRRRHDQVRRRNGPIPARAGEPTFAAVVGGFNGAYPRSRGGTGKAHELAELIMGLSPLARGNPTMRC